ncbi:MAG: glycosyltransferase family 9 protein [Endomicrobium sp.]|jgi:ADP-heptose:LPS heptosyltransferase|nr:glycosyltransferase family 9 protein [Endomicrobium sp.]
MKIKNAVKSFRKSLAKFLFDKREKSNKKPDFENAKSVLFLRDDDKIGDMVVSTLLFREMKKKYPDKKIYVLCGKNNREIIKHNPYVDETAVKTGKFFKDLRVYNYLNSKKIDVFVDFFPFRPRPLHLYMLRKINPEFLIGFNKENYNIYDFSLNSNYKNIHITKIYSDALNFLGIANPSLKYDVFLSGDEEKYGMEIREKFAGKKLVFLNTYAAKKRKNFSLEKTNGLIDKILSDKEAQVILNAAPDIKRNIRLSERVYIPESKSILYAAALIKYSDFVITPDTSIVHISAAFDKKMIALYMDDSGDCEKLNKVWAPNYDKAVQISVDTKNGAAANDINNINNDLIIEKLTGMLK